MTLPNPRLHTRPAERLRASCVFAERFITEGTTEDNGCTSTNGVTFSRGATSHGNTEIITLRCSPVAAATRLTAFLKFSAITNGVFDTCYWNCTGAGFRIIISHTGVEAQHKDGSNNSGFVEVLGNFLDGEDHYLMYTVDTDADTHTLHVDNSSDTAASSNVTGGIIPSSMTMYSQTVTDCTFKHALVFTDEFDADDFANLSDENWPDFVRDDLAFLWRMDSHGNDTDGDFVRDIARENALVKGDGSTAGTFPVFTDDDGDQFYALDSSQYFDSFPTLPTAYTISAAVSDTVSDGRFPEMVQADTDASLIDDLSNAGSFSYDNIHNLYVSDRELTAIEKLHLSYLQRQDLSVSVAQRALACFLNEGIGQVCLKFTCPSTLRDIAYDGLRTATSTGATYDATNKTYSFDTTTARLNITHDSADADTRKITLVVLGALTGVVGGGGLIHKGIDMRFTVNNNTLYLNSSFATEADLGNPSSMYAVTAVTGHRPRFFRDGRFIGEGDSDVTLSATNTDNWTFGNSYNNTSNLEYCNVSSFLVFNEALTDNEVAALLDAGSATAPIAPLYRITEADDFRITEADDERILQ